MQNIFTKIGEVILTVSMAVAGLFGFNAPAVQAPIDNVGATIPVSVAVFQTSLASSITSSATSMTLVTGTDKSGDALSGYICFNIDEGTSTEEFVCGTASGTAISSMIRGIDPVDGDLEVTALKKAHRRGASVKITNYPSQAIISRILNGDETLPNILTYASAPTFTTGNQLITKTYADALAIAGAPDASTTVKGIGEEATEAEINAGTAAGGTSARLFINPSTLLTSNFGTRLPTSGEKSGLVGNNTDIAVGTGNKYVTQTGLQKNEESYATSTTGNDTYVVTLSPVPTSLVNGMKVRFKPDTANTGAATLNVNSLGALSIVTGLSTPLATGDILANQVLEVVYNSTGTVWQLVNPIPITSAVVSNTIYPNVPNTAIDTTSPSYLTYQIFPTTDTADQITNGWIDGGTNDIGADEGGGGFWLMQPVTSDSYAQAKLAGTSLSGMKWDQIGANAITLKFRVYLSALAANELMSFGLTEYSGGAGILYATRTSTTRNIRFVWEDIAGTDTLYITTANGTTATATSIGTSFGTAFHDFTMVITSTSVAYYVDATLVGTHTTNIPTGTDGVGIGFGIHEDSTTLQMGILPTTISIPLTF